MSGITTSTGYTATARGSTCSSPFTLQYLPTELKLMIARETIRARHEYVDDTSALCFIVVPAFTHVESDGSRFRITIKDLIRWYYPQESIIFPKQLVMNLLFPHGVFGNFNHLYRLRRHGGIELDVALCNHIPIRGRSYSYPDGTDVETIADYFHFEYLCLLNRCESKTFRFNMEKLYRQDPCMNVTKPCNWQGSCEMPRLWRFLGAFAKQVQSRQAIQTRYDYLATLTTPQRKEIDALLDSFVNLYVMKFRHNPPNQRSPFYLAYHHASLPHDDNRTIAIDFDWTHFTHSGAFHTALKHLLLSISYISFKDLLGEGNRSYEERYWLRYHHYQRYMRRWEEEIRNNMDKTLLVPEVSGSTITLRPETPVVAGMSMTRFVQLNPLWAWERALELPQGQALVVDGVRPYGARTDFFAFDRFADLHPEWDSDVFGGDYDLAGLFADS